MGFKMIENATRFNNQDCILFKKRTNEPNYVRIINGDGCHSRVNFIYFYFYSLQDKIEIKLDWNERWLTKS